MPPRAIWAYRGMEGRVRSSLSKFRDHNLTVLADVAAGRSLDRWQAQGIRPDTMELIRSFDWERTSPASASALFWYVRNRLVFDLGLTDRSDLVVISYRDLVSNPREAIEPVLNLLDLRFTDDLIAHIDARESSSARKPPLDIDPRDPGGLRRARGPLDGVARGAPRPRRARPARGPSPPGGRHDLDRPRSDGRGPDGRCRPPRYCRWTAGCSIAGILAAVALTVVIASLVGAGDVKLIVYPVGAVVGSRAASTWR